MKIVLYDDTQIIDIIEDCKDIEVNKNNIKWRDGTLNDIKVNFSVVNADDEINDVSDINIKGLNESKKYKIQELKNNCTNEIYNGFVSTVTNSNNDAYEFGFHEHDQLNFNSQLNKINLWKNQLRDNIITQEEYDNKFPLNWKAKNLGVIQLTEEEFIQVLDDAENHLLTQQNKYWNLESQVNNTTTVDEVNEIVW